MGQLKNTTASSASTLPTVFHSFLLACQDFEESGLCNGQNFGQALQNIFFKNDRDGKEDFVLPVVGS